MLEGQTEQNFSPEIKDVMTMTVNDLFQQVGLTDEDRLEFTEKVVNNAYDLAQKHRHGTFDPEGLGQLTYKKLTQHNTDKNRNYSLDQLKDFVAIQIKTIQLFLGL